MTKPSFDDNTIRLVFPPSLSIPSICFQQFSSDLPIIGLHPIIIENANKLSFELTSNSARITDKVFLKTVDSVVEKILNNKASPIRGFPMTHHDFQNATVGKQRMIDTVVDIISKWIEIIYLQSTKGIKSKCIIAPTGTVILSKQEFIKHREMNEEMQITNLPIAIKFMEK